MPNGPEPENDPRARRLRESPCANPALRFGGGRVAVAGVLAGLGIAVGVPAVLLALGQGLDKVVLTVLLVMALAGGGLICLVSAFFGLVIPRHMAHGPWMDPDRWRRFAWAMERRHELHRRRFRGGPWAWSEDLGGDDEDEDDGEGAPGRARGRGRGRARPIR